MSDQSNQDTKRPRNRRAKITDSVPETLTEPQLKTWVAFVHSMRGTELGAKFESPEFGTHTIDLWKYPPHIVLRLAQKAAHNKHMDSYADPAEVPDPIYEVRAVDAELIKGVWSQRGEGGPRFTLLAEAVAALAAAGAYGEAQKGLTVEQAQEVLDSRSKEERKALQKDPAIAAKTAEIQAKKAAVKAKEAASKAKGLAVSGPKLFG